MAHAMIAARAGRPAYSASARDLADLAGVTHWTATAATRRLLAVGLLALTIPATASLSNVYRLRGQSLPLPKYTTVREWKGLSVHDVFRHGNGLGKLGAAVWQALQDEPLTASEVAERIGCHVRTARRTLARMAAIVDIATGEIMSMVKRDGDAWRAVAGVNLDDVALALGTAGTGERQRERHSRERELHRRSLEFGRLKT